MNCCGRCTAVSRAGDRESAVTGTLIVPAADEGLAARAASLHSQPVVTMCGHGERAATAASLLERARHPSAAVATGVPADSASATGLPLEVTA
jgi:3-mercaptopyruvate sulfurtransferase SseA